MPTLALSVAMACSAEASRLSRGAMTLANFVLRSASAALALALILASTHAHPCSGSEAAAEDQGDDAGGAEGHVEKRFHARFPCVGVVVVSAPSRRREFRC
jgi:hypothetical protein